jgi:antirestriction protein ArdC
MSTATMARRGTARRSASGSDSPTDVYQLVTDQIIDLLDAGTAPWHQPWCNASGGSSFPRSLSTGKPYRGINPFLLQVTAVSMGYSSPWWGTYDQIKDRGGQVRKGEKGTLIVFWRRYVRKAKTADEQDRDAFVLRYFKVFNTDQADGLTVPPLPGGSATDSVEFDPVEACETALADYYANDGPQLVYGGNGASYNYVSDIVRMPERSAFESPERFYGTWFHETTHSTGHKNRLARPDLLTFHEFGDENYSREELVAEMGAAFLSGITGIGAVTLPSSASYLASWVRVLRGDKKLIVSAAAQAQRAADLILGIKYGDAAE